MIQVLEEREFEERSDYINDLDLELWNVQNNHFDLIQKKLLSVGAKLFSGPRGTGKTHQMRLVHLKCIQDKRHPLSIFVSFSKYYHLEPFLTKVPNALQVFHTWVLAKIILGCYNIIDELNLDVSLNEQDASLNKGEILSFVNKAEKLQAAQLRNDILISSLSITKVIDCIEKIASKANRGRIVLMLDDAALTLTPEYLIEFFDIFRSLKTKSISPKASVYPGTTQYGPRFHVGQDAEMIQCWLSVDDSTYATFMDSLIEKRFSQYKDDINTEVLNLFKYASFGVPRAFISLLRNFKDSTERNIQSRFNNVINQQGSFIETEYLSISQKLLQYKGIIETGFELFKRIVDQIKEDNKNLVNQKNIFIGISSDSITNYKLADRMLRFLIEAGLLYEDTSVKHGELKQGEQREYKRYIPHFLFLIQNRTFNQGRGFSFSQTINVIQSKSRKHPLRRSINNILTETQLSSLVLDLPPCQVCNTPRPTTEQRFCANCGTELINHSAFEKCLTISVDDLPLTTWQKEKVKEIGLNTVGDFLALQDPGTELRKIRWVGAVKSEKIYKEVTKTVDEFLA